MKENNQSVQQNNDGREPSPYVIIGAMTFAGIFGTIIAYAIEKGSNIKFHHDKDNTDISINDHDESDDVTE